MLFTYYLFAVFITQEFTLSSSSSSEDVSISKDLKLDTLFKLPLTDTSDSTETKKTLKEYYRWLTKKEQKYYIDKYRKEMSQEEKDQVKFYENLLQHIKGLSKKMSVRKI
ncbi:uncharacterized protein LOC123866330 [Maniola jurtina]|uniref:uncharacterized protein LOC123866330 n=1 Tax=Maniola jurtina TaxID=191418 RepID=UPI001E68EDB6|nr:uncharacterized protein LOC123866330 [Maniola jurtina]